MSRRRTTLRAVADVALGRQRAPEHESGPHIVPYLRAANVKNGVLDLSDVKSMNFSPREQQVFSLRPGDVLVTEGSGSLGVVGSSAVWRGELDEPVCFQNTLLRLRPRGNTDSRFLAWWTRHARSGGLFSSIATGANIYHISAERVRALPCDVPSIGEQRRIADFLDAETARIDHFIRISKRGKELLAQRRWATVYTVATGADHRFAGIESNLGWVQRLPKGWPVVKLNRVARLGSGHTPSRTHPEYWMDCNIPWISLFDVGAMRNPRQEYTKTTKQKISQLGIANSSACIHPAGTVALSRTASVGFSTIMATDMAVSQHFVTWTCGDKLLPEYLLYLLRAMRQYFDSVQVGTTNVTVFMPDLQSIKIPLPSLAAQNSIVREIRYTTTKIDKLADRLDRQLELLKERREALITAAVTGEFDVSSASGRGVTELVR